MSRIIKQYDIGNYIVLCFEENISDQIKDKIKIDNALYKTEIVFDLDNSVAIKAQGDFMGQDAIFVS